MNEHRIHQIFQVGAPLKGARAAIECVRGIGLAVVSTSAVANLVKALTQKELLEEPKDFVATHLLAAAQNFSVETKHFYAFYLLSHGIVKLLLFIGSAQEQTLVVSGIPDRTGTLYCLSAPPFFLHRGSRTYCARRARRHGHGPDLARMRPCAPPSPSEIEADQKGNL
jgi:hypothetical protein